MDNTFLPKCHNIKTGNYQNPEISRICIQKRCTQENDFITSDLEMSWIYYTTFPNSHCEKWIKNNATVLSHHMNTEKNYSSVEIGFWECDINLKFE